MVIAAVAAALAMATPAPVPSATPPPSEIFDRAFARLSTYPVAPYALMVVKRTEHAAAMIPGAKGGDNLYPQRYAFRTSDGAENAAPFTPDEKKLPEAIVYHSDARGPFLWSIRRANVRGPDEPPVPELPEPFKTIGRVVVHAPPSYSIADDGIETVDGHATYHLRLTPLSDPQRHNLRELWVDTATFDLWKARFDGTYHPFPGTADSASVFTSELKPVGPFWVTVRQEFTWTDFRDSLAWNFVVDTYVVMFPDSIPDWIFDQAAYDRHRRAGEADVLDAMLRSARDAR